MKLLKRYHHPTFHPHTRVKLYEGKQGTVYRITVVTPLTGLIVTKPLPSPYVPLACKEYHKSHSHERHILEHLNATPDCPPSIVQMYGYNPTNTLIVMEAFDTDLYEWYNIHYNELDTPMFWEFASQLIEAIQFCHRQGIAHTDIKLENIGFNKRKEGTTARLALLDFGHAVHVSEHTEVLVTQLHGSPPYTAPEVLENVAIDDQDVYLIDYWELGVVLFCILERRFPWTDNRWILTKPLRWSRRQNEGCRRFVSELLCKDPHARLNLDKVSDVTLFLQQYQTTS